MKSVSLSDLLCHCGNCSILDSDLDLQLNFVYIVSTMIIQSPNHAVFLMTTFHCDHYALFLQTTNGLSEESSTDHLEFPLLTQRCLSSITQLLPFLRTLCCSFQGPPLDSHPMPHFTVANYPAASSEVVLKKLECITEEEFLDSMES